MNLAPICLFVYKRQNLTELTINYLKENLYSKESDLYIFSDAAKYNDEDKSVNEVREYINGIDGFNNIYIKEQTSNLGLANSIISGVTEVINKFGKIIVLEDDLITSKYFLKYMNEALDKYQNEDRVISIHGYIYPIKKKLPYTFFIKGTDCWGWGTWKNRWDLFEKDGQLLLKQLRENNLLYSFDHNGSTNNVKMLRRQIRGEIDSWAIRWHASAFLKDKLTLYPGKSLVNNIGMGGASTHVKHTSIYNTNISSEPIPIDDIPIEENDFAKKELENFYISIRPNFIKRYYKKLKFLLGLY